jgi:uncharacterized iron-regulated membrane protein
MTLLQRAWRTPQDLLLRRILFQIHLWCGIAIGLYLTVICLSGSILVYRNELYRYFEPKPVFVEGSGTALTEDALRAAAKRVYPEHEIRSVQMGEKPNQAVEMRLQHEDDDADLRLFHPVTGQDIGNAVPLGYRITAWMLKLHDDLLNGQTGRKVNGAGAIILTLLCLTGAVLWWPGIRNWTRSVFLDRRANWKRFNWSLHSVLGFWFFAFVFIWGFTGAYLSYPDKFSQVFDWIQPLDENSVDERLVDRIQYWIAYLHFGRLGGRGIPWCGRGLCDSMTKATWATIGVVPPILFFTGAIMWWSRSLRPRMLRRQKEAAAVESR